ncbi:hypothetical protein DFH08DRAFT_724084 [Mycena albidolilacea]|uniref:C2H2-type domain-containing protein n=1 Tax=Mycena albidolilacea TaxID=1033008 RepID=A0AAD7E885_9AGAR|nr:hypothetical protein DFH08DRAFT_724084 [Mycena albidolilacea]
MRRSKQQMFMCLNLGCENRFSRAFLLKAHIVQHHTSDNLKPICCNWPQCGTVFAIRSDYERHE